MITLKNITTTTFVTASALALAACGSEVSGEDAAADDSLVTEEAAAAGTIPEVAAGDETFSTLVAAVTAAELGETLSGEGPFTVFAPTNDAFGKLPEGTVETLTTEDTETLTSILTYHVVEGAVNAATLTAAIEEAGEGGYTVTTVGGGTFSASVVDGAVVLTDATGATATVTATDVEASNGLIHVIDTVLMPG
ncbi:MAG: fasciclin domain-containing protein [Pseudomonadota bacterium]